ncbi:MAG TPA: hypothetical protein VEX38_02625, partial [Fimbriimonadaceae bacterium]|nr:hypothetical protein [Fimbriimonadaceae bacterium]
SKARITVLRLVFALVGFGQIAIFWPKLLNHSSDWALKFGNEVAMISGMAVLMVIGILFPLRMLPILVFEFVWKCLWLIAIYSPLAREGRVDGPTHESLVNVGVGAVVCGLAIPWGYVWRTYLKPLGNLTSPEV